MKWIGNFDGSLADITSVVAGTGLSGGGTSGAVTLNVDASQTQITSLGTIGTGVWQGTAITASYIAAAQSGITSLGTLTGLTLAGNKNIANDGDGAMIHVDSAGQTITENETAGGGTAAKYAYVNIEGAARLAATNSNVTTTDAATLYVGGAPVAYTNMAITNPWALWVDAGNARFDGDIDLEGDMDINGTLETDALTVGGTNVLTGSLITTLGTISNGVWNGTAIGGNYIAATQPNIDSIGTDGDTLAVLADDVNLSSGTSTKPTINLLNTTNNAICGGLNFTKLRDDNGVAQGTLLGGISFNGEDDAQNPEEYAFIRSEIDVSTNNQESGKLVLGVANHDGGSGDGLILTGGDNNDEIHITVGLGAASVVTIPGDIDLAGDIDVDGTLETDALTVGGTAFTPSTTKQMTHHVFVDDMALTKQYIGLLEADAENTNTANKNLPFPAITAGKLIKVALRSNKNLTGHTLTWRLESIGAANPNSATPDILGTQSGAGCNNDSTTMTTYDFTTGLDSGANAFDASDLVYLSIQSDTDFGNNVIYYITCLWEWDLS